MYIYVRELALIFGYCRVKRVEIVCGHTFFLHWSQSELCKESIRTHRWEWPMTFQSCYFSLNIISRTRRSGTSTPMFRFMLLHKQCTLYAIFNIFISILNIPTLKLLIRNLNEIIVYDYNTFILVNPVYSLAYCLIQSLSFHTNI